MGQCLCQSFWEPTKPPFPLLPVSKSSTQFTCPSGTSIAICDEPTARVWFHLHSFRSRPVSRSLHETDGYLTIGDWESTCSTVFSWPESNAIPAFHGFSSKTLSNKEEPVIPHAFERPCTPVSDAASMPLNSCDLRQSSPLGTTTTGSSSSPTVSMVMEEEIELACPDIDCHKVFSGRCARIRPDGILGINLDIITFNITQAANTVGGGGLAGVGASQSDVPVTPRKLRFGFTSPKTNVVASDSSAVML